MKKFTVLLTSLFTLASAQARLSPVRGEFDWKKLVGNYTLVLSHCTNTSDSSDRPGQSFAPISEKLKISVVNAPVAALQAKGEEQNAEGNVPGLLVEAQIDGVATSAVLTRIGSKAFEKVISEGFPDDSKCNTVTRTTEAFPTNLGVYGHITTSHPNCQNERLTVSQGESIKISLAEDEVFGDKIFLTVHRDYTAETSQGFECKFKRVP